MDLHPELSTFTGDRDLYLTIVCVIPFPVNQLVYDGRLHPLISQPTQFGLQMQAFVRDHLQNLQTADTLTLQCGNLSEYARNRKQSVRI